MTIKLGTHTSYDKRTTPIDFQGQGSKVKVTRYTLLLNLVNMIQTEPFQLWPSNLVCTLLMTRGWHLYIFKFRGQRSKINPFYIANYKVISLFKSPVGRILQRWRCFGIFCTGLYAFILLLYFSKRSNSECQFSGILEGKRRRSPLFSNGFCYFNYWAWVIKLKSCLHIVMPLVVANYCLNTSPHRCTGVR